MSCLTHEQMLLEAFGLEQDATLRLHLKTCSACREQLEAYRQLPERFAAGLSHDEQKDDSIKERLLSALPARSQMPVIELRRNTIFSQFRKTRLGEIMMKHRFAFGGSALVSVVVLLVWAALWSSPLSAMEQTAEAIRKAKSYQCDTLMVMSREGVGELKIKGKWYRQGSWRRMEMIDKDKPTIVELISTDQPGVTIDHRRKSYSHRRPMQGKEFSNSLTLLETLGRFSDKADEDLGSRLIGKIKASGFRITFQKLHPDLGEGTLTVWTAPDTKLPVLVEIEFELSGLSFRMENFRWNVDLKPELFKVQPPDGYTESTSPEPTLEEQAERITEALKFYAATFEGNYPQVKVVYGDVTSARLEKKLGIPQDPREAFKHPAFKGYRKARLGNATIGIIQRDNPDAKYCGKTVGPTDAGKVLFYWKLLDGSYRVIYGDLNSETVTKEKLRSLVKAKK
jgi:outer membrane lipoprotein-sorting protein